MSKVSVPAEKAPAGLGALCRETTGETAPALFTADHLANRDGDHEFQVRTEFGDASGIADFAGEHATIEFYSDDRAAVQVLRKDDGQFFARNPGDDAVVDYKGGAMQGAQAHGEADDTWDVVTAPRFHDYTAPTYDFQPLAPDLIPPIAI